MPEAAKNIFISILTGVISGSIVAGIFFYFAGLRELGNQVNNLGIIVTDLDKRLSNQVTNLDKTLTTEITNNRAEAIEDASTLRVEVAREIARLQVEINKVESESKTADIGIRNLLPVGSTTSPGESRQQ